MNTICLYLLIVFSLVSFQQSYAEDTIRLASGEWSPYQSEKLKYNGVVSRIVSEAFRLEGMEVEFGYFPWNRSFHLAKSGKWDGTFIWFDTPERRKQFYISDPVIDIQYVFFHMKNFAFDWNNIEDLADLRVGVTLGYNYGDEFQEAVKQGRIRASNDRSDADNFTRLESGIIQIFPCEIEVGKKIILEKFGPEKAEDFTYHPLPVKAAPHHLLMSLKDKRNKERINTFNKGLKRLKDSGKYDQYILESRRGDYQK